MRVEYALPFGYTIQRALNEALVLAMDLEHVSNLHNSHSEDKVFEVHFKFNGHDVLVNSNTKFDDALQGFFDMISKDAAAQKDEHSLKLYIWDDINCDYTCGMAFAIASSVDEARALILAVDKYSGALKQEPDVYPIAPICRSIHGGS